MIVVDASVVMKWGAIERGTTAAIALQTEELAAPMIWVVECAKALWRRVRLKELSAVEAARRLARLQTANISNIAIEGLLSDAFRLSNELNRPVYDCLYLSAAIQIGTKVITADRRFGAAVARHKDIAPYVELLADT